MNNEQLCQMWMTKALAGEDTILRLSNERDDVARLLGQAEREQSRLAAERTKWRKKAKHWKAINDSTYRRLLAAWDQTDDYRESYESTSAALLDAADDLDRLHNLDKPPPSPQPGYPVNWGTS